MYIKTIKLEKAALKAFRNDPLTDSDEDLGWGANIFLF